MSNAVTYEELKARETAQTRADKHYTEFDIRGEATPYVLDMDWPDDPTEVRGNKRKGSGPAILSATPKQIRARARRKITTADETLELLGFKPVEEWDDEELARGRPRNENGGFKGMAPKWVSAAIKEEALKRFGVIVKAEMNYLTSDSLKMLAKVMEDTSTDNRGKPNVSASVKVDIAKFLLEHIVGKPTARVEQDISVRLQGVLGMAIMQPDHDGNIDMPANVQPSVSHAGSYNLPQLGGPEMAPIDIDTTQWDDDDDD